jgi:cobalt-zinc-cadmium efflux system membrane fusion protein
MKKLMILMISLVAIAAIALATLHTTNVIDIHKMVANILLEQHSQNTVREMEQKEKEQDHAHEHDQVPTDEHLEGHEEIVKLEEEQIKKLGLQIQTANPGKMLLTLSTRGKITLDPDRLAHVIPKISGIAIEARKNMGSAVKA